MNQFDLIAGIAARTGGTKTVITSVLDALADEVVAQLAKEGAEVPIPGVGKLKTVTRPARTGRNPATGAPVEIPEKRVVKFVPGKALKDALTW